MRWIPVCGRTVASLTTRSTTVVGTYAGESAGSFREKPCCHRGRVPRAWTCRHGAKVPGRTSLAALVSFGVRCMRPGSRDLAHTCLAQSEAISRCSARLRPLLWRRRASIRSRRYSRNAISSALVFPARWTQYSHSGRSGSSAHLPVSGKLGQSFRKRRIHMGMSCGWPACALPWLRPAPPPALSSPPSSVSPSSLSFSSSWSESSRFSTCGGGSAWSPCCRRILLRQSVSTRRMTLRAVASCTV